MAIPQPSRSASNTSTRAAITLIITSLLAVLLSIYQWIELVQLRTAGDTLLCSFNATFNCAGVWNSALAQSVHKATYIPVVGWGLAWSFVVFLLALWLLIQAKKPAPAGDTVRALRLTTGIGALVCILLLAYSVSIKIFCPTCILFYLLVAAAAYLAFRRLRTHDHGWGQAVLLSAGLLLVTLALLLYPGLNTPRENLIAAQLPTASAEQTPSPAAARNPLEEFLNSLPMGVQQATSDSLAIYRRSPLLEKPVDPKRLVFGPADAPVRLIEWTDIRCPHCKNLETALSELHKITEPGSWSQESRHFPLDSQCNSKVNRAGDGVSCLAAKLEICLIGSPDFARVRTAMFEQQDKLTQESIWDIVGKDPARRTSLQTCVDSPATAAILKEDIEYADQHKIEGTPLVVINGRKATALPAAILSLIITKGHDDDPAFLLLPSPDPEILR